MFAREAVIVQGRRCIMGERADRMTMSVTISAVKDYCSQAACGAGSRGW
jgi:hypothetical protein